MYECDVYIFSDLEVEEPRTQPGKKTQKNQDDKYNCKCLKLNNNVLTELKGFSSTVEKILVDPMALSWVDLSFNELTKIDPVSTVTFILVSTNKDYELQSEF